MATVLAKYVWHALGEQLRKLPECWCGQILETGHPGQPWNAFPEVEAAWVVLILLLDSASPEARGDFSRCVLT